MRAKIVLPSLMVSTTFRLRTFSTGVHRDLDRADESRAFLADVLPVHVDPEERVIGEDACYQLTSNVQADAPNAWQATSRTCVRRCTSATNSDSNAAA